MATPKKAAPKEPEKAIEKAKLPIINQEEVPAYLRKTQGEATKGFDEMRPQDVIVPRIALCQSNSPYKKKTDDKYIQGLDEGQFFNTVKREIYGDSVLVVPLFYYLSRIRFGATITDPALCQAFDGRNGKGDPGGACVNSAGIEICPMALFGSRTDGRRGPACTMFMNYMSIVTDDGGNVWPENIAVVSFKSTNIAEGKNWNSRMRMTGLDMFAKSWRLTPAPGTDGKNSWWAMKVEPHKFLPEGAFKAASIACDAYMNYRNAGLIKEHDIATEAE